MGAQNVRYLQQRTGRKGNHGLGFPLPRRGRQSVERALRLLQACETDVDIAAGGLDRTMAQQMLTAPLARPVRHPGSSRRQCATTCSAATVASYVSPADLRMFSANCQK